MASLSEYKTAIRALRRGRALNYRQAKLFCRHPFFAILLRTEDVTIAYEKHTADVLAKYNTMEDYILCSVFGFLGHPNSGGRIRAVASGDAGPGKRLVENAFPYHFGDDVTQFVLWSLTPLDMKDAETFIEEELACRGYDEYCCAINVEFQTIPGLWHVHVIAHARAVW